MRTGTKAQRVRTGHFLPFGSPTSIPQFPLFPPPTSPPPRPSLWSVRTKKDKGGESDQAVIPAHAHP